MKAGTNNNVQPGSATSLKPEDKQELVTNDLRGTSLGLNVSQIHGECHFHVATPQRSQPESATALGKPCEVKSPAKEKVDESCDEEVSSDGRQQLIQVGAMFHQLWCLPVRIGRSTVMAYVDVGAMSCVMRKSVYDMYPRGAHPLRPFHGVVRGISDQPATTYGVADIAYDVDGYIFTAETVIADVGPQILLGLNFLKPNGALVDHGKGVVYIGDQEFNLRKKTSCKTTKMVLINNVTVAGNTEHVVDLRPKRRKTVSDCSVVVSPLKQIPEGLSLIHISEPTRPY